ETVARWLAAGILTGVIGLAQPLWLPGVVPVVAVVLFSRPRVVHGVGLVAAAAAVIVLVRLAAASSHEVWIAPVLGNSGVVGSLPDFLQQIYVNLTGAYYLTSPRDPPGLATYVLALVWCGALAAAPLLQLYRLFTRRYCLASHLLFVSIASTLGVVWIL